MNAADGTPQAAEPAEAVSAAVAQAREHRDRATVIGTVLALRSVTLRNELAGTVKHVALRPGQIVQQGTVLVALDVSVERADLQAQRAELALARTALQRLRAHNATTDVEVDRARAERDVTLARIARTQAIIERKTIRVPFRARVGLADVHPGQYLNEGTPLTTLQSVVRGFLTTPIERAVSAIGGVDHVESTSRARESKVTVHLKLNHDSTAALAEVTARLQQVRSELPAEAEPPAVEVQRADRPYGTFYLSFNSSERSISAISDYLLRNVQPQLATIAGVQRVTNQEGGRNIAMRVWLDPERLAALNLAPGDVQAALQRNNYLAAVGQTRNDLVQVNVLTNTDLRSVDEFKQLIVAERSGAVVRLADVARRDRRRRGAARGQVPDPARRALPDRRGHGNERRTAHAGLALAQWAQRAGDDGARIRSRHRLRALRARFLRPCAQPERAGAAGVPGHR